MDNFEAMMKKIMVSSMRVCGQKCIPESNQDYLTPFEKSCLSKCADKYFEIYFQSQNFVIQALPTPQEA